MNNKEIDEFFRTPDRNPKKFIQDVKRELQKESKSKN